MDPLSITISEIAFGKMNKVLSDPFAITQKYQNVRSFIIGKMFIGLS